MRALLLDKTGPVSSLHVGDLPVPEPGTGEIRVKVRAVGLNPVDYKLAGRGNPNWKWPHLLGSMWRAWSTRSAQMSFSGKPATGSSITAT